MDEQPITPDEEVKTGAEDALPEESDDDGAALEAPEQKNQPQGDDKKSVPEVDDKLQSFAKGLGIEDLSSLSERELKLLKVAKDNQAEYQRNAQKASELEKTLKKDNQQEIDDATASGEVDPGKLALAEIASLKLQNSVNTFFTNNPDAKKHEADMVKLVSERPEVGQLVRQGALSVSDLYALVRGTSSSLGEETKAEGAKEALQQLANKQIAKAVPGSATTSSFTSSDKKDAFEQGFDSQ
ncbi:MAG TPA: hypothetical protein VJ836_00745 [Candidatus Saccharimonadales bacterium]|nr:hypothetical protein [Candidatus Saccharimonadales bacterium]